MNFDLLAIIEAYPQLTHALLFLTTFILEDAATLTGGLLIGAAQMEFLPTLVVLAAGITLGDLGLYGLGRLPWTQDFMSRRIPRKATENAELFFNRYATSSLFLARFIPGLRLPLYFSAGALGVSLLKFVLVAVLASLLWTVSVLYLVSTAGALALEHLHSAKWTIVLGLLAFILFSNLLRIRRSSRPLR